ncbi:MAG: hypothetical protein ACOX8A_11680, partial [Thermacetogeniaceae bacterium]
FAMAMTNKDWLKLMEEKEDEIREKLEELYLQAAHNHDENFGSFASENCLILDDDGELSIVKETPNTMDGRVWAGKAMYIAKLKDFHLFENEDEEEWIRQELGEKFQEFEKFLEENDGYPVLDTLKEYDSSSYQNIIDDMAFQVESIDAPDWAELRYHMKIAQLKEEL